jgi:di/tricarboxylate transporter
VTLIRAGYRRFTPSPQWTLRAGDTLLLEGESAALEQAVAGAKLKLAGSEQGKDEANASPDDFGVMEAVVTDDSLLVGRTPAELRLGERFQVGLLAVSRRGERLRQQLRTIRFRAGDVIVLQGNLNHMPEALAELSCLPLAGRNIGLGRDRWRYLPIIVLAVAMASVALQIVPVAFGFFSAALALILARSVSLREAYDSVEWPLLVLIGSLIPVSEAMQTTGATDIIAQWLSAAAAPLPAHGALALILIAGMAVTPFLNNAATVLVMAPIAARFAHTLGYNPDPFLMAVALGAASDFLTPIGHQCNTLVLGPGGYRFGDYWRLGLPLSILVVVVGVPLIALVFPF